MIRKYKVSPHNSTVCGVPGRKFDWALFCWDGSAVYVHSCFVAGHPHRLLTAPLPHTDSFFIARNCEYIHVPYDWQENGTIYRVRPNESMYAGRTFRGLAVKKQSAVKRADGWYWILKGAKVKR